MTKQELTNYQNKQVEFLKHINFQLAHYKRQRVVNPTEFNISQFAKWDNQQGETLARIEQLETQIKAIS